MRVFVDEGAPMAELLRAAARGSAPLPLQHYGVALAYLSPMPRVLRSPACYCENATLLSIAANALIRGTTSLVLMTIDQR